MKKFLVLLSIVLAVNSMQAQEVVTLLGYLHVYPKDLGYHPAKPINVINAVNSDRPYGFDDWRLPTAEEMALILANTDKVSGLKDKEQYMSSDGYSKGNVRLVTTGKTVVEKEVERKNEEERLAILKQRAAEQKIIPLAMHNAKHGKTCLDEWIYVDDHNNFVGASFALPGLVDSISLRADITTSNLGWTNKIAAAPRTGIIAYLKGNYYIIYVDNYVVSTNRAIMGVRIRYRHLLNEEIPDNLSAGTKTPSIFITVDEDAFGKRSSIIADKLKTELTKNGCSLTQNAPQSHFQLYIKAATRQFNSDSGFNYCYADVTVELFNTLTGTSEYFEDFSQKGISTSRERAAREALTDASAVINEKIKSLIFKTQEQ